MSLSKYQNTLKRLKKINAEQNPIKYVSVVYMDNETGEIDWHPNSNPSGVLVVPMPMTEAEWQDA